MRVDQKIVEVISGAAVDGCHLLLQGQLDRKSYAAVAKVIEAAGGRWDRKAKAHVFDGDAAEAIEPILLTGEIASRKQAFGQFYTPAPLARRICDMAGTARGSLVLEPSAGRGALVAPALEAGATVRCVEIDDRNAAALAALGVAVAHADFLTAQPTPIYDVVLMNPPFARQADIDHVRHALQFLGAGGRLVAIMSASTKFRRNQKTEDFLRLVNESGGEIADLPDDTFKESGTGVRSVLVTMSA